MACGERERVFLFQRSLSLRAPSRLVYCDVYYYSYCVVTLLWFCGRLACSCASLWV